MNRGAALGPELSPPSPTTLGNGARRFELTPRCSLTPHSARIFVATVAAGTFALAGFFTWQGFWPVLLFAGVEIGLLIWAVSASMRKGAERETITITEDSVVVRRYTSTVPVRERGSSVFPRHWVKVKLHAPSTALHPSRLVFESHGRACEVGRFLTEDERRSLAVRLKQLVGNTSESPALR